MNKVKRFTLLIFCLLSIAILVSPQIKKLTGAVLNKVSIGDQLMVARAENKLPETQQNKMAASKAEDFVGSQKCADCHTNIAAHYQLTPHAKVKIGDKQVGCESCHGSAINHVALYDTAAKLTKEGKDAEAQALYNDAAKVAAASMRSFDSMTPAESTKTCLKCHEGSQDRSDVRFNYLRSEHFRHGVSCLDCHSSHSPKRVEFLLKETEPEGCYKCHADQKISFARPFHHKVPEGGMKCSDCHNQHGGFQQKQIRNWIGADMTCTKCHTDKQGPFVYEHAPLKIEGCQACHTPHGATNPKLLKRNEVRFLCLECHSNTPGLPGEEPGSIGGQVPHNLASSSTYNNCVRCHTAIHGSNSHPRFYR
ncbi:MAG: DmsE family decaheme c-type cytochrome [Acidobacteria bacterium]|nr:DmsE family decaheme c-type cytochrome [Acidobacteriota bacterium]